MTNVMADLQRTRETPVEFGMPIPITRYDYDGALGMVREFTARMKKAWPHLSSETPTAAYTESILDWFAAIAPPGTVVDACRSKTHEGRGSVGLDMPPSLALSSPRKTVGECLFDLTHWQLPSYSPGYGTKEWWRDALGRPEGATMTLAVESEMGKANSAAGTLRAVMDDASKLLAASCRIKVVVFASVDVGNRKSLVDLAKLVASADRTAQFVGNEFVRPTWVWTDLPWNRDMSPTSWIVRAGDALQEVESG